MTPASPISCFDSSFFYSWSFNTSPRKYHSEKSGHITLGSAAYSGALLGIGNVHEHARSFRKPGGAAISMLLLDSGTLSFPLSSPGEHLLEDALQ